jgi:hypothetical protein
MDKQQTTVEWIEQEILKGNLSLKEILIKAKEMEKEQIIKAASDHCYPTCELATIDAEQYYEQTYGGNK